MYKNVTQELKHLIPVNTLGLRYDLVEKPSGELIFEVSREGYFLGLTHVWRTFSVSGQAHTKTTVRPRHINRAIKQLENRGVIRAA